MLALSAPVLREFVPLGDRQRLEQLRGKAQQQRRSRSLTCAAPGARWRCNVAWCMATFVMLCSHANADVQSAALQV
eukprot:602337-Pleurochrysis_carterae.AAC.3